MHKDCPLGHREFTDFSGSRDEADVSTTSGNRTRCYTGIVNVLAPAKVLFTLVYVSSATELFSTEDLVALLETSRRNNARDGVTGMLLYKSGNFMQVLEGEEEKVREIHERIRRDPRHRGLITLLEQRCDIRQFGAWSMGFRNLNDPSLRDVPGFNEFLNISPTNARYFSHPSRVQKLLRTFRQSM